MRHPPGPEDRPHLIQVLDRKSLRGVPLVELCTTSNACFITASQGLMALNEPAYWDQQVFFKAQSPGYQHASDLSGVPGLTLPITRGGFSTIKLTRLNVAERLYRVTGEGIYRDSILANRFVPVKHPLINSQVTGLYTVMHALYRGRIFWLFGHTEKLLSSLGNLATTCAQSDLPSKGPDPERAINLEYFAAPDGFVKPMADLPGPGLKWMFALAVLPDPTGKERLLARYDRRKSLEEKHDAGLALYEDAAQVSMPLVSFDRNPAVAPDGRPVRVSYPPTGTPAATSPAMRPSLVLLNPVNGAPRRNPQQSAILRYRNTPAYPSQRLQRLLERLPQRLERHPPEERRRGLVRRTDTPAGPCAYAR